MNCSFHIEARSNPEQARAALAGPLPFGKVFADLMVRISHTPETGWHEAAVVPFGPISLSPAAKVFHYGQEIFEGLKAFAWQDDRVALFRPEQNARRLNESARKMVMPEVPEDLQLQGIELLVDLVRDWVPRVPGGALYLRPVLIGTDSSLGVAQSSSHLFMVLASPVGAYFRTGTNGISVWIEEREVRAFPGGLGSAKAGGNYACGLPSQLRAKQAGFDQVLFLDGARHRFLEELNGMNLFLVQDGVLCTPPLGDTVLDGITRRSLLDLAEDLGFPTAQRPLAVDEVLRDLTRGNITEMFVVGTAAAITLVETLGFRTERLTVGTGKPGPVGERLRQVLQGIQSGRHPDTRGWMRVVSRAALPHTLVQERQTREIQAFDGARS